MKKKDKYKELAGEFKNEGDILEEADEEELDLDELEREHFDEDSDYE